MLFLSPSAVGTPAAALFCALSRVADTSLQICSEARKLPGCSASHGRFRLVLLCSQPDTVHEFPLRRAREPRPRNRSEEKSCLCIARRKRTVGIIVYLAFHVKHRAPATQKVTCCKQTMKPGENISQTIRPGYP